MNAEDDDLVDVV